MKRLLSALLLTVATTASAYAAPHSGVFRWGTGTGGVNMPYLDTYGTWLGTPTLMGENFPTWTDWSSVEWADANYWGAWVAAKPGRAYIYSVPPFTQNSGGSLAQCQAGAYNSHWTALAHNLMANGLSGTYLRIGHEMDGGFWYGAPDGSGLEATFAACWRTIVNTMRAAEPTNKFKFVLNPTDAGGGDSAYLARIYPGDTYVDKIGLDLYDQDWSGQYPFPSGCTAACVLQHQQAAWANRNKPIIETVKAFALAHSKPWGLPEWGVNNRTDGHGGLDDPYYIQQMWNEMTDPANPAEFEVYFDVWAGDGNHLVFADMPGETGVMPNSAAQFKTLFNAATFVESPDGTTVTAPGQTIIDSHGNSWGEVSTSAPSAWPGMQVTVGGAVDPTTDHVDHLVYSNHAIWQECTANSGVSGCGTGLWWSKTQPSDTWLPSAGTTTGPVPACSTVTVTSASGYTPTPTSVKICPGVAAKSVTIPTP